MSEQLEDDYGLSKVEQTIAIAAPQLDYKPPIPNSRPGIGLIGCGGIAAQHLTAYRHAGFRVVALCDKTEAKAEDRRQRFAPDAAIYTEYRELLKRDDVEIVDITTYPIPRVAIIEDALRAGKHVLSQKPFVVDLDVGERLVELADQHGLKLAVNQNGRWAPHFAYMRQAVAAGLVGDLGSVHISINWDHSWIADTSFNDVHDLLLYDFTIHWFDMVTCLFGDRQPTGVYAAIQQATSQRAKPPMLGGAVITYAGGQAVLSLNATVVHGQQDRTFVAGSQGSLLSIGPSLSEQTVTLFTAAGHATPALEGTWFREGFQGTMAELICAIEQNREPLNSARANLRSLALTLAAVASTRDGIVRVPGTVRRLPEYHSDS
ncbi:MAG: Gfo/Idh/MocA family oxidoreductase [Roseiflexaceae bacterium]|nr:Gfo/Idh/MocA family oxidoreductase [Roseiflexaceae bacterium]